MKFRDWNPKKIGLFYYTQINSSTAGKSIQDKIYTQGRLLIQHV